MSRKLIHIYKRDECGPEGQGNRLALCLQHLDPAKFRHELLR